MPLSVSAVSSGILSIDCGEGLRSGPVGDRTVLRTPISDLGVSETSTAKGLARNLVPRLGNQIDIDDSAVSWKVFEQCRERRRESGGVWRVGFETCVLDQDL